MKNNFIISIIIIILLIFSLTGCNDNNKSPIINFFTATPSVIELGNYSVLKWSTINAEDAIINNGIGVVPSNGEYTIQPTRNSTYILTAVNSYGYVTESISIIVN